MSCLDIEQSDRAAAALNIGRRICTAPEPDDAPIEVFDADTGALVITLADHKQLAAFVARYDCNDVTDVR
jgi:hypothetical protein